MFAPLSTFSGLSVSDLDAAKQFYHDVLGCKIADDQSMGLDITLSGGGALFIYEKADHQPASFTVLNFVVSDIDAAVDALVAGGVVIERYDGMHQDERGIARGLAAQQGPDIAWFKDPAGNILSVLQSGR